MMAKMSFALSYEHHSSHRVFKSDLGIPTNFSIPSIMGCVLAVHQMEPVIVERFGKFSHIARPGFLCLPVPCICVAAGKVNLRVREATVKVETKTKDNVFVRIDVNVQYAAIDKDDAIYDAYYKLTSPVIQLTTYVDDAVRSYVPHALELDELFEAKQQVAMHVESTLEKEMATYGYRIVAALVTNIEPEPSVRVEMNEINANKRLRQAKQEVAEGEKYLQIKHAEANAESTFLQGQGVARQRKAIVSGLQSSVEDFSQTIGTMTPKEVLDLMMMTQYLDTTSTLGGKGGKVVLTYKRKKDTSKRSNDDDDDVDELSVGVSRGNRMTKQNGKDSNWSDNDISAVRSMSRQLVDRYVEEQQHHQHQKLQQRQHLLPQTTSALSPSQPSTAQQQQQGNAFNIFGVFRQGTSPP